MMQKAVFATMVTRVMSVGGSMALLVGILPLVAGCEGGGEVDGGGPDLLSATVTCTGDSSWTFSTQVTDPDGEDDIATVYVDVYDTDFSIDTAVSSIDLEDQGGGLWSKVVEPSSSNGLDACAEKARFEFDYVVQDLAGNRDGGSTTAE